MNYLCLVPYDGLVWVLTRRNWFPFIPERCSIITGLTARVATSGMATIYRATDLTTDRTVAIKLPHFEMESDPVFFDRFQREEAIGTTLSHPGNMKVFAEENRSRLYMVLEWIEGRLLRQVLNEQGKLSPERAVRMALQICNALDYIHGQGVVHRDLKPENIMVDAHDHIKLIDFGIASKADARRLTFGKLSKTQGTPEYISPEQVKGKRGDARIDLYSLGVILYEMLTGETPFPGPDPFLILNVKLHTDPRRPGKLLLISLPLWRRSSCGQWSAFL
jgi:eukaryotic-like serine/threonine-protein kinase